MKKAIRVVISLLAKRGDLTSDERFDLIEALMGDGMSLSDIKKEVPNLFDAAPSTTPWTWTYPTFPNASPTVPWELPQTWISGAGNGPHFQ